MFEKYVQKLSTKTQRGQKGIGPKNAIFKNHIINSNSILRSHIYGVLHRISLAIFLKLKIQFEMARFEPQPSEYQSNRLTTELS